MKIGLVIYGSLDTVSGGYLYDRLLVRYLERQGDSVQVLSLPVSDYALHFLDNLSFRLPGDLDVVIEDELNHASLLGANRPPRPCPVVALVHNLRSSEPRAAVQNKIYAAVERRYLLSADALIYNSPLTRQAVGKLMGQEKPYVIASPGGDRLGALSFERVQARAVRGAPLRLLFLANVTRLKGLHVVLAAVMAARAARAGPLGEICLDVVGSLEVEKRYVRAMRTFVQDHALAPQVSFHGILDGPALVEQLERADLLVVPSAYEGFGIAYAEGMAFGLPPIATRSGAAAERVVDGENGFLIQPGDVRMLAERLTQLAQDRELLLRLSLAARSAFDRLPTWDQSFALVRAFLLKVIS